jgi:zinc/manganese transport system substrate-binding protein
MNNRRFGRLALLPAALVLCGGLLHAGPADAALSVFACEPEWGALVRELAGDLADVYVATTAQQDPHQIQARPSLIARIRGADLVVCTGAELEVGWLPVLQRRGGNPKVQTGQPGYFEAAQYVHMLEVPERLSRAEGDVHPEGNPHIQTDPRNIVAAATPLARRLETLDGANRAAYEARLQSFVQRWTAAMAKWELEAAPLKGVPVVSHHKSWAYLYDWLGIDEVGNLEPKPGVPPSTADLEALLQRLKERPARMVVYAAYQDPRPDEWLSKRAGIPAVPLPFTVGGSPGATDLFGLYEDTIQRLLAGMKS